MHVTILHIWFTCKSRLEVAGRPFDNFEPLWFSDVKAELRPNEPGSITKLGVHISGSMCS